MGPWTTAQVRLVAGCDLVAALIVVGAAMSASDQRSLQDQIAWVNAGVLGLLLAVVAHGGLFLIARKAIGRRRLALVPDLRVSAAPLMDDGWWWVPGTNRAHRRGCQMTAGKAVEEITVDGIRSARLQRCELCG